MHSTVRAIASIVFSSMLLPVWAFGAATPQLLARIQGSPGFGIAANASDLNGDGFEDLLVSGPVDSVGAFVYFGGQGSNPSPLAVPRPPQTSAFGWSLVAGRDLNGDGHPDFAIANVDLFHEAVFIYFGGPALDGLPDVVLQAPGLYEFFGAAMAMADLNRDGIADLAIGAPFPSGNDTFGSTYVYFGGATIGPTPNLILLAPPPYEVSSLTGFGDCVAGIGDVNADGIEDLLAAEHSSIAGLPGHSRALLFFGGVPFDPQADRTYGITLANAPILQSISGAGDFNADGIDDVVAGAPTEVDGGAYFSGSAYVYFGSPAIPADPRPGLILRGNPASGFGMNVCGGRDVSGDGFTDVLVGQRGTVFLYHGGPAPSTEAALAIPYDIGSTAYDPHLAMCDWNHDGVADVVIGVPGGGFNHIPPHVDIYDVSEPLTARAFVRGQHRSMPRSRPGGLTVQLQCAGGSYLNSSVDLASLRLVSEGTGPVSEIAPVLDKTVVEQDTDHDGIPELTLNFRARDVEELFASIRGRQDIDAAVVGNLISRRRIGAPIQLAIVGAEGRGAPVARLSPNPLNPNGVLEFTLSSSGAVSLRVYDVAGRCVRTLVRDQGYASGRHTIPFAARDDQGQALSSGVYFYQLDSPEGIQRGRFVVAK